MRRLRRGPENLPRALAAAAVLALLAGPKPATAANDVPGDVTAGRLFAGKLCARCHDVRRNGDLSPLPEAPAFQTMADTPAITQLSLRVFLQTPHVLMPDLHLTAEERDDVISYILSLKTNPKTK